MMGSPAQGSSLGTTWLDRPPHCLTQTADPDQVCPVRARDFLIGKSLENICRKVDKLASWDVAVLVRGPSGSGKELIARALHFCGKRARGPFIPVNCAAIPDTLLESEIFGHEKGAFSGAVARRIGLFELAHGGTLFLDEIGDMTPALQAKMLRGVEERRFRRLGGSREIEVDVRMVCATNKALEALVAQGKFREDLLYRIRVAEIELPPLRERRNDIVELTTHLLAQAAGRARIAPPVPSDEVMRMFRTYSWPGNVRELKDVMEAALPFCEDGVIQPANLPPLLVAVCPCARSARLSREQICQAVTEEADVAKAADRLNMHSRTLYRRMRELDIPTPKRSRRRRLSS